MPRSVEEILEHADDMAVRLENYEPSEVDELGTDTVAELRDAAQEPGK